MILFLTYHKVLTQAEESPEFYSITAEQLERHLELLQESGFRILPPPELLELSNCCGRKAVAPESSISNSRPVCVLSFDDGTVDHFETVLSVLARRKCRGLFFVPTHKLNRPGYLQTGQLSEICRAGHEIGSHGHEHRRLDRLPEEDIRVQLEISQQRLAAIVGAPVRFFAPVGGFITPLVRDIALESGARAIRTMRWGYNHHPSLSALECIPLNRHVREPEFRRILSGRRRRMIFTGKELAKKILPGRAYERLRKAFFSFR